MIQSLWKNSNKALQELIDDGTIQKLRENMVYNGGISNDLKTFSFTSYFIDKNIWEYLKRRLSPTIIYLLL